MVLGCTPFFAVKTIGKVPVIVGVPLRTPVAVLNATPLGSVPLSEKEFGAGVPVAVTVKVPSVPTVNVVLFELVIVIGATTVSVKDCVALGTTPFCALIVTGYAPTAPATGVPLSTPVIGFNPTPPGSVPEIEYVGAGDPVAVIVKELAAPYVNAVEAALVIDGAIGETVLRVVDPQIEPVHAVMVTGLAANTYAVPELLESLLIVAIAVLDECHVTEASC